MPEPEFTWKFRAKPIRVIDGDTIEVVIDHGFRHYSHQHIRLKDINCPELRDPDEAVREAAKQARLACQEWLRPLMDYRASEWPLVIYTAKLSFDRWVGVVVDVYGESLGEWLVNRGHATRVNQCTDR